VRNPQLVNASDEDLRADRLITGERDEMTIEVEALAPRMRIDAARDAADALATTR
jgi:hypothetical protein